MSCSHPLRESTTPVKVNLNMKLKLKLPLKRYHISVLFQCHTNTAGCALEISCRSPTRRGETYHHRHRKFLTVSLRSQHGRKRPHQAVLVRTNLQWWRRVFRAERRNRTIRPYDRICTVAVTVPLVTKHNFKRPYLMRAVYRTQPHNYG